MSYLAGFHQQQFVALSTNSHARLLFSSAGIKILTGPRKSAAAPAAAAEQFWASQVVLRDACGNTLRTLKVNFKAMSNNSCNSSSNHHYYYTYCTVFSILNQKWCKKYWLSISAKKIFLIFLTNFEDFSK